MRVTQLLNRAVACQPTGVATIFQNRQQTWTQFSERVSRFAGALTTLNIEEGACVGVLAMNSDRYAELFYSVPWAGGVLAPLNMRWSVTENEYALTDSSARILIVDDHYVDQAYKLKERLGQIEHLIFIGDAPTPSGMLNYEELIGSSEPTPDTERKNEDLYVIFYTGGTTAHPKGVAMSHRAIVFGAVSYLSMLPTIEGIRHLYVPGFFHFASGSPLWYVTLAGGTHVIQPKFDPLNAMQAIQEHNITNTVFVPTMVNMLINHDDFEQYDLSSLKTCVYGGSPMPEALIQVAIDKLPSWNFFQIYGMTETGGFASMLRWAEHLHTDGRARRLKSAGQPAPGVEIRTVRENGGPASPGELGEITVRSDILMTRYLNNETETHSALRDGWMHTGDAGYFDKDGFLYVADRVKDMIITGGENVYSIEVERILFKHPDILEAAVIGIPCAEWGERVHAVVVPRKGRTPSKEEILTFCREYIAGYKVPKSLEFRDAPLPITPVGKVRKNVLRNPYWLDND